MKYQCTWLRGAGWEKDRPNKSKVLIDRRMTKWGFVLVAKPLEPFARMTREAQGAMIRAARDHDMLCLVTDWENTELVIGACGDAKHVEPFQQRTKGKPVPLGRASDFTKIENLIEQVEAG